MALIKIQGIPRRSPQALKELAESGAAMIDDGVKIETEPKFAQGDIVRVWVDDALPEPDHNLPSEGWDAIVVGTRDDGYAGDLELEVAWLDRFTSNVADKAKPVRETWDDSTSLVTPGYDGHVKILKRATYVDAI